MNLSFWLLYFIFTDYMGQVKLKAHTELKAHCNNCLGETNHILLHKEQQSWKKNINYDVLIHGSEVFNTIKCCGCDSIKLMHKSLFSEICDEYGRPIPEISYYPPAISRAEPKWLSELGGPFPSEKIQYIRGLIKEIYSALHNNSYRLAVMGIRALIEHLMIIKVSDHGAFKKNLDAFQKAGYLSDKQKKIVQSVLEAGHATIHRAYHPNTEDILTIVDITESLFETIYVLPQKAETLEKRVPQRNKN